MVLDNVSVRLKGYCLQVEYEGTPYPLSLIPSGFFPGEQLCVCSYPNCKYFKLHSEERREVIISPHSARIEPWRVPIDYERVVAAGIFYQKWYRYSRGLKTEQLYNSCTDLNSLIGLIRRHRPRINLLTAIIYCNKVSSNEWIYDILGEALSIALSLVVDSDTLSRSMVTYTPRHKEDMKEDRFKGIQFNQAELLAISLARRLGLKVVDLVEKIEPSRRSPKDRAERYLRALKLYRLRPEAPNLIRGLNVIFVDDVRTTGATSTYISTLLRDAGAQRVYVAVAGRSVLDENYNKFYEIERDLCGVVS
jgi:predicted amidophosphoribosyltransferase